MKSPWLPHSVTEILLVARSRRRVFPRLMKQKPKNPGCCRRESWNSRIHYDIFEKKREKKHLSMHSVLPVFKPKRYESVNYGISNY